MDLERHVCPSLLIRLGVREPRTGTGHEVAQAPAAARINIVAATLVVCIGKLDPDSR